MAKNNVAPIIVKKMKKGGGDGHHGGAWKVAYADFVTAMMAFFLMMWLLNATTESQRKGLADYFAPTIALSRTSGGGTDSFGGDDVFSQDSLSKSGSGANAEESEDQILSGSAGNQEQSDADEAAEDRLFQRLDSLLAAKAGESDAAQDILKHIKTRVTDEGLVIEIFDTPGEPLFVQDTVTPTILLEDLLSMMGTVLNLVRNDIAVAGHTASRPIIVRENPNWDLSTERAQFAREHMEAAGITSARMRRVTGHADRTLSMPDPLDIHNNRLEITVLRSDIPR